MTRYKHQLISALLDKYERSSFFREGTQPTRRIMLKLYDGGLTEFPQYDIEQPEKRMLLNRAVLSLYEARLVSYQWMRGEENHIIAKIWLNFENISFAYALIGRQPKSDTVDDVCLELLEALDSVRSEWVKQFLSDVYDAISRKRSVGNRLPADKNERTDLFRAICFIDQLGETEMLERVFSLQCFGDSKRFEKAVKSRLLGILSKYLDSEDDNTDEALLRQVGITKYPEQFEFCGQVSMSFHCGTVDFSHLMFGGVVNSADFQQGYLNVSPAIDRVLSIENRANYIEYIYKQKNDHELVIYHGGQFSPAKRKFLRAVAASMSDTSHWYHWGDIDYGGFSMLARLRREIKHDVIPYRMDKSELIRYALFTASVQPQYIEKLCGLKQRSELGDCLPCIDYMIENRVKLEQEAMLTDSIA
ncbi:MAG: Wadjet anti-phage system protein JetD domain-containing protein [Bacillota bacterium]